MDPNVSISAEFEEEVRAALAVEPAKNEFVAGLRRQVLAQSSVQRRTHLRPAWAAGLSLIVLVTVLVLASGPQRVWAAVRSLFGYLPEVGFVEVGVPLRVVELPVEVERDGIVLKIDQGVADSQQLILRYQVEGIQRSQRPVGEDAPGCINPPYLRLANGAQLQMTSGEGRGWPTGYQSKYGFQAVPAGEDVVTLVVPCLDDTRPGAAPENWEITLRLVPAPPGLTMQPVIELPTDTAAAVTPAPEAANTPIPGIQLQVEKMVELDSGFIFEGSVSWDLADSILPGFSAYALEVRDDNGQPVPIEDVNASQTGNPEQKRLVWSVQTNSKAFASPLIFTLPEIEVSKSASTSFDLNLGENPQPGQVWEIHRDIVIDGHSVRILTASFDTRMDGTHWLTIEAQADPSQLTDLALLDPDNHSARLGGGGGSDGSGKIIQEFSYDYLPTGVRHIQITRISYKVKGPWEARVEIPSSAAPAATTPVTAEACMTTDRWLQLEKEEPAGLPAGIGGTLLVEDHSAKGQNFPSLIAVSLPGGERKDLGEGGWSSLSPNGRTAAFITAEGMSTADVETGSRTHLSWSGTQDYHPIWSPDGAWLAFTRGGEGVYVSKLDGSGLMKIPGTNESTFLVGWMPDGRQLVVDTMSVEGSTLQTISIDSGETTTLFTIDNRKGGFGALSAGAGRIVFYEKIFGSPTYGVFTARLNGEGKRLTAWGVDPTFRASVWSPDGHWLVVNAIKPTYNSTMVYPALVDVDTCQAIRLAGIEGQITGWAPGQ